MNQTRVVIKRPLLHYFISLGYILAPIVNILLLLFVARIGLGDIIERLFQGYGTIAGIWLLTAPIVGIGLYFVHKASWYIFLAHSGLILFDYVYKWVTIPTYYWLSVKGIHQLLLFSGNVALVIVIGYIIQKDFRAPYFQVLPRGWRTNRRVPIRHYIMAGEKKSRISDLSISGCFAAEPGLGLEVGEKMEIRFTADVLQVRCRGEVMRRTPDGFGIRFLRLPAVQKRDIRSMLKKRFPFRYEVEVHGNWRWDDQSIEVTVLDISTSGCYIRADVEGIGEGAKGTLEISSHHHSVRLPASVVWINDEGLHGKPRGFGARFLRNQKRLSKRIVEEYGTKKTAT